MPLSANAVSVAHLRRAVSRHRGLLAAGLAAGAAAGALSVLAPTAPRGVPVVVATHDLAAGTVLVAADVRLAELPAAVAPTGALSGAAGAVGRLLAGPLRRGEPLTDVRLAGPSLLTADAPGLVATPVRIADAASAALVAAGDHIDVLAAATAGTGQEATVVASDAEVLAAPATAADTGDGALVLLATTPQVASRLAAAAVSSRLSLTLRPHR